MISDMDIGRIVRQARLERLDKMSQAQLAERMGTDQGTVSNLERGRPWTVAEMIAAEQALELAPGYLLRAVGYLPDLDTRASIAADPSISPAHRDVLLGGWDAAVAERSGH